MARITAIEPQKRHPDRMNIQLDGEYAFSLAGVLAARLQVGQQLGPSDVTSLVSDDAREQAYASALHFLSYRTRSEAEIRQHLRKQEIPDDVLEDTIGRLRNTGQADDMSFAGAWIENRSAFRPRSRRALAWELRRKGVPDETAESALAHLDEPALAYQAALKKSRQLSQVTWVDFRTKIYAFLARRGFSSTVIMPIITRLWAEIHAGQPTTDNEDTP